ncbi:MAG: ATP-binding protein [Chloroflexales bacterium]
MRRGRYSARKRNEAALRRYAERLSALRSIDRAILEAQTPEQVGMIAVEYLRRLVPCERATVMTYDEAADQLRVLAVSTSSPSPLSPQDIMPIIEGDRQSTVWERRPWHLADAPTAPSMAHRAEQLKSLGVRSLLHIPLFAQDTFIGTLTLSSPKIGVFGDEHVVIATEMVDQIALAIHKVQLLTQIQTERAELSLRVRERTAELSATNVELAHIARRKDEFLTNMSHELRTPLNSILGRAEILREQIYGPLSTIQQDSLRVIEESGRHLLALINDILDLSKIEAGKIELNFGPVPIIEVIHAALRMVAQTALQKRISLAYPSEIPEEFLFADARRLKQILVNLLSNAVKFTLEGGQVGLEVHRNRAQGQITFTVWDTGIGVAAEDLPRLFKPFSQIDSSLSRQHDGSGLGLALVANLADLHGGSSAVESTPGEGSHFSVTLPWRDAVIPAPAYVAAPPISVPPRTPAAQTLILVAEDNEVSIELMCDYLTANGYAVAVARNGAQALAHARELNPALILMDIQMPLMDGLEATRRIRADGTTRAIPIIALTALAMQGDRERCLAAGVNTYFSKPVELSLLGATIAALLNKDGDHPSR